MMENNHLISVILPVHNGESYIEACLNSLLNQTYKHYEIIVVDDGSTDSTVEIVKSKPVKFFQIPNSGRAFARNIGIKNAKGDIIVFVEDDGVYPPGYLEEITKPLSNKKIGGVIGPYSVYDPKTFITLCKDIERKVQFTNYQPFSAWAYRTALVMDVGGFDEKIEYAEDVDLGRRILNLGNQIVFEPKAHWFHREPSNINTFLRRRFRAGAASILYKLKNNLSLFPKRAIGTFILLFALIIFLIFYLDQMSIQLIIAVMILLLLIPPLGRFKFLVNAIRISGDVVHSIGWVYIELLGWFAATIGSFYALIIGTDKARLQLRGR